MYQLGPLGWFLIGVAGTAILNGVGRSVFGGAPRNEARERLQTDLLVAKLNRNNAETRRINEQINEIRAGPEPLDEELRRTKIEAIRSALPLDLARKEVELERETQSLENERALSPFIEQLQRQRAQTEASLEEKRLAEAGVLIDLAGVRADQIAADAELKAARADQERLNRDILEEAIGSLDAFGRQQFIRERFFPKPQEPRRGFEPTRIRTITSF